MFDLQIVHKGEDGNPPVSLNNTRRRDRIRDARLDLRSLKYAKK